MRLNRASNTVSLLAAFTHAPVFVLRRSDWVRVLGRRGGLWHISSARRKGRRCFRTLSCRCCMRYWRCCRCYCCCCSCCYCYWSCCCTVECAVLTPVWGGGDGWASVGRGGRWHTGGTSIGTGSVNRGRSYCLLLPISFY